MLELTAFLLRCRTSFLAQVVTTLTGPREPGRNCQTPTPPPLSFPSLCESANPERRIHPFVHSLSQGIKLLVFIHPYPVVFSPSVVQGCLTHPKTKVKKQNPKIQKQKEKSKKKRWSANPSRNPLSLDKVTLAKPESKTKQNKKKRKAAREASWREAATLVGRVKVWSLAQRGCAAICCIVV